MGASLEEGPLLPTLRFGALVAWAVGVQAHEFVATVGASLLVLTYVPALGRHLRAGTLDAELRPWRPLVLFIGWALLAPTIAGEFPEPTGSARILDWATIPLVANAANQLTIRRWKILALASLGTLAVSGLVAGFQHFGIWPPLSAFESVKWTRLPFHRVYEPIADSGRFMGGGLMFHRLKFGHVSGLVMLGAVVAARRLVGRTRLAIIALGLFGFVAVWLFPYARMAAFAMTVAGGLTLVHISASPGRALLLSLGLALVGVAAVMSVAPLRERFASTFTDRGSGQRTQHLAAGLEAIRQHPITGVGPGQFRPSKFATGDMSEHVRVNPGKAHNQFVSMAAETGIPGGVLFITLLGWLAWRARGLPLGGLTQGAIVSCSIISLAHDPLFHAPFSLALALAIGLGLKGRKECL